MSKEDDTDKTITRFHVNGKTSLARDYFEPQCHHAGALYNSAIFVQRNLLTALTKNTQHRSDNEQEVLDRLDAIQPKWRKTRIHSLSNKIAKKRAKGEYPEADIEKLLEINTSTSLYAPGEWMIGYYKLDALFKWEDNQHYRILHTHVAQNTIREVADAFTSFIDSIADYKQNPSKYTGRPQLPGYMKTGTMRTLVFSRGDCKIEEVQTTSHGKEKCLVFPKTNKQHFIPVGDLFEVGDKIGEVRVKPVGNGFEVQIVNDVEYPEPVDDNGRHSGGDLGLDNLIAILGNVEGIRPLIVDGREVKSINQYFNKKISLAQAELPTGVYTSAKIQELYDKRARQLRTVLGFAARLCAVYLHLTGVSRFVVGKNNGWKQKFKSSKRITQSFAYIPYEYFLGCLERRCRELGIGFITTEESYTSKASLTDLDEMPVWDGKEDRDARDSKFSGKRVSRGRYVDSKGRVFNADINAAGNSLRKVFASDFDGVSDFGYAQNPYRARLGVFTGDEMTIKHVLCGLFSSENIDEIVKK